MGSASARTSGGVIKRDSLGTVPQSACMVFRHPEDGGHEETEHELTTNPTGVDIGSALPKGSHIPSTRSRIQDGQKTGRERYTSLMPGGSCRKEAGAIGGSMAKRRRESFNVDAQGMSQF